MKGIFEKLIISFFFISIILCGVNYLFSLTLLPKWTTSYSVGISVGSAIGELWKWLVLWSAEEDLIRKIREYRQWEKRKK